MNYNCFNFLYLRNLQEQVKKAFGYQKLFWPFAFWINCSSDPKIKISNSRPSTANFKSFSKSLEHFFLTVGQNNFGNKIPLSISKQKRGKKIRNCRFTIGCLIWWTSKLSQSINLQYLINGIKCILVWRQKTINTDLKGILIDNSLKLEMLEKRLALLRRASFFSVVHVEEFQAQIC